MVALIVLIIPTIDFLFSLPSSQSWNRSDYWTSINKYSLTHWVGRLKITVFKILSPFKRSICDNFEIPHVKTRWTVMVKPLSNSQQQASLFLQAKHAEYSVNLAPHTRAVTRAFRDLIIAYGWRSVLCDAPALLC